MAGAKQYNLRTRDMYHPLYSTYQLDYLRPNVWEIVIGGSSPGQATQVSQAKNTNYNEANAGKGRGAANSSDYYTSEGHTSVKAFNSQAVGGLSLYCNKFQLNLPKSSVITVPWISGVTKLAGRNSDGFQITAEFYAGLGANSLNNIMSANGESGMIGAQNITDDVLRLMYAWRNLCFDARSGQIGLAPNYKKPATIFMYDPSGVSIIYEFTVQGLWPSSIGEISLDVESNDIVKLQVTMEADFVYMVDDYTAMDDFYNPKSSTQAGSTSRGMLYSERITDN